MSDITRRGFLKGAAVAPLVLKPLTAIGQQGPRTESFDIVVAGAGHNSLVTAAYLAKAGYRCVVLEGRPTIGGGVKTAELTLRGFQDDVCSTAQYFIQSNPMLRNNEIPLHDYGLEYIDPDPIFHMAFLDGSHLTQWRDVERTIAEFAKFSKKDASAYRRMYEEFNSVAPMFRDATFTPIGFGPSLPERLSAHPRGKLWQRRLAMSAWEIIRANFEDEHSLAFMVFLAHITSEAPDAPIRLIPGPDPASFAPQALPLLLSSEYRILPSSNRVGTRLDGPALPRSTAPEVSRPMVIGAIEVPRDGKPIVLGPEHPTTGGYPIVAVVARADLGRLFSIRLGGSIRFTR